MVRKAQEYGDLQEARETGGVGEIERVTSRICKFRNNPVG